MKEIFLSPYKPSETEERIYKMWEESGFFNPDNLPGDRKEVFSIILPPPNVTGILHLGSAIMLAIEDTMVRYARMRGKKTLWVPGTDSAAIATQAKVEKEIQKKEKLSRHDLGREELLKRINTFVEESKATIISQIKSMGASLDWSRYAYTMDDKRYGSVMEAFVRMYNAGLIYRGNKIVNWDPKGQTTISDDEIVYEERDSILYTFKYSKDFPIAISTTRPETKVGDTGVAIHPDDKNYDDLAQDWNIEDFVGVKLALRVVKDGSVDPAYGTGALGVTPSHSMIDWEIAERHGLAHKQVIDEFAKMTEAAGPLLAGKKVTEAREIVVEWLKKEGLLIKEEKIKQNVATAERTGGIVEPLPKLQWFIDVNKKIAERSDKSLKELMREPFETGEIKIIPDYFSKTYFHWIENLRDWCISRQIWFGHRIPVWYKGDEVYCGLEAPSGEGWQQDPDVLDTWFSSALWPFSTLGWPEESDDLKNYYPTTILETGYDIIFFWVARMVLAGQFLTGKIPFKAVYLHGIVRDKDGNKISKSLGNNIDPVEMGQKYGTDALRLSLIAGMAPGTDSKISEEKIRAYGKFANKIWNITRFVLENSSPNTEIPENELTLEFDKIATDVTSDMENFRFHLAAEKIYHYIWHRFADEIIEESKKNPEVKKSLLYLLENSLKLLHPFMPFITEEIWSNLDKNEMIMVSKWPS